MADLASRHPRLNLPNLEAVAATKALGATLWLSEPSAAGVLPGVLESEGIPWEPISLR